MAKWNPGLHPRGPVGRFVPTNRPSPRVRNGATVTPEWSQEASSYYSTAENDAISSYVSGSQSLNNSLRGLEDYRAPFAMAPSRAETVANLDRAIDRFPLPETVRVHRGVDGSFLEAERLQPGDQIWDQGYLSTSTRDDITDEYGDSRIEIKLPKGTRVIPAMTSLDDPFLSGWETETSEQEVIVGRGSVLQVRSITPRPTGGWLIRADLVGYLAGGTSGGNP